MKRLAVFLAAATLAGPAVAADHAHWGYHGDMGPGHWGDADPAFAACKSGTMQSPIDIGAANERANIDVTVAYRPVPLTVLHNGHTVQFNVDNGSVVTLAGKEFKLLQVHFHTPSEHADRGVAYPLEAHFVHKSADGQLAVIGVLFTVGAENTALGPVLAHLPMAETPPTTHADSVVDLAAILPSDRRLVRYQGSLTTPPCSEGVNWMVMRNSVTASKAQIDTLHQAMGDNARPIQAPGNRLIVAPL